MYLEPAKVPQHLRSGYTGAKFKAEVSESVTIPMTAGLWSGGSRDTYQHIRLSDGATVPAVNHNMAPTSARHDAHIDLQPGFAVVEHTIFCGKDLGLTFFVHPADVAALLPAPGPDISTTARKVLGIICTRIPRARADEYRREGLKAAEVETAKAELLAAGFINKAGAVTVAGRNAR